MTTKPVSKIEVTPVSNDEYLKLTLMAGQFLNAGKNGISRPLQVCLYVVNARDWQLPLTREQGKCVDNKSDMQLFHTERVFLAPGKTQDVILPMKPGQSNWLIVNPDYSQNLMEFTPQKSLMNSNVSMLIMLGDHTKQTNTPVQRTAQNVSDRGLRSDKNLFKIDNSIKNGIIDSRLIKKKESIPRLKNTTSSSVLLINN